MPTNATNDSAHSDACTPVDADRIRAFTYKLGVTATLNGSTVAYAYPEATFGFSVLDIPQQPQQLVSEAVWSSAVPTQDAPLVLAACNEWNLHNITPALHFIEPGGDHAGYLALRMHRSALVDAGLSDNQLGAFITTTIELGRRCCAWLQTQLPNAINAADVKGQ